MVKTKGKKIEEEEKIDLEEKDPDYQSSTLSGSQVGNDEDVDSTDIDKLAGNKILEKVEEEDDSFGNEHTTDDGGIYKRSGDAVLDQDSDNPPAGTAGHPGIDEDTS